MKRARYGIYEWYETECKIVQERKIGEVLANDKEEAEEIAWNMTNFAANVYVRKEKRRYNRGILQG